MRDIKLHVARSQLGTALDLFIRGRDPYSVHSLCCGACEILQAVADRSGIRGLTTHILETIPDLSRKELQDLRVKYWNALKHASRRDGTTRDDTELLQNFSDETNDTHLYAGWYDYLAITKRLPIEAQVFQVWWHAVYEQKLSDSADLAAHRKLFPDIQNVHRTEQKRKLRRACERFRRNTDILQDSRTEPNLIVTEPAADQTKRNP